MHGSDVQVHRVRAGVQIPNINTKFDSEKENQAKQYLPISLVLQEGLTHSPTSSDLAQISK